MDWPVFLIIAGVLAIVIFISSIKIVRQSTAVVVERLGTYRKTLSNGFHLILPFFDKCKPYTNLKEQVLDFKPQPVITKDNVTMQLIPSFIFRSPTPNCMNTALKDPSLLSKTSPLPPCVISWVSWNWTKPSQAVIPSTPRCV